MADLGAVDLDLLPPAAAVARVDGAAERRTTPCGAGAMVWRAWGAGEPLLLLHGGYGSWTHWIRNIPALAGRYRVLCPDLPGFGDSATPPRPHSAESLAGILADGLRIVLGDATCATVGFSFGAVIGGHVAARLGPRVRSLTLVGAGGLGARRGPMPDLVRRTPRMTAAERAAAHRRNLEILMFADPARIDALALHIQRRNTERARVKSRPISATDTLARALAGVDAPLHAVWGALDATAGPYLGDRERILRRIRPSVAFRVLDGVGHWAMYEAPEQFDSALSELLG